MYLVSFMKKNVSIFLFILSVVMVGGLYGCNSESSGSNFIPLSAPKSIQITGKDGELMLLWSSLAQAQGVNANYEVWYGTSDNVMEAKKWADVTASGTPLSQSTITGLTNGTTYYVWVKAFYGGLGSSPFSATHSGMPVAVPSAPSGVAVTVGETLLEVTWAAPAYAFSYDIAYSATSGAVPPANASVKSVSSPATVLTGLTNGTEYFVWVKAVNTAGDSAYSPVMSGTPVQASAAPSVPADVNVESGNKRLMLTWASVSGASGYELYYNTVDNPSTATLSGTVEPAIPNVGAGVTGLTNGTPYYVWVKSKNSAGSSAFSAAVSGTPEQKSTPINFSNFNFVLGAATGEYIFAEELPLSAFKNSGRVWDRLTRVKETALGNLFTDATAWYAREKYPAENIDFVFLNGGFIDNAISKGQLTVGKVLSITDPDSREYTLTFLTLKGSDVIELFKTAAAVVHTGRGGPGETKFWAMTSKEMRYTVSYPEVPAGTAIQSIVQQTPEAAPYEYGVLKDGTLKLNGQPVDPEKNYRIATTSGLASGAFFTILAQKGTGVNRTADMFWQGVAEYIYDRGAITPYLDGRLVIEGGIPLGPSKFQP